MQVQADESADCLIVAGLGHREPIDGISHDLFGVGVFIFFCVDSR
jgi:hypothetical protein